MAIWAYFQGQVVSVFSGGVYSTCIQYSLVACVALIVNLVISLLANHPTPYVSFRECTLSQILFDPCWFLDVFVSFKD